MSEEPLTIQINALDPHTTIDNADLFAVDVPVGGGLYETRYVSFANLLPASVITAARLASNAVLTAKIADAQVTAAKMAADAKRIVGIVRKSGNQLGVGNSATLLTGWTDLYDDDDSLWDNVNNQFEIQTDGIYMAWISSITQSAKEPTAQIMHTRDAVSTWIGSQSYGPSGVTSTRAGCFGVLPMEAGDVLKAYATSNSSGTMTLTASIEYDSATFYSQFGVMRIN